MKNLTVVAMITLFSFNSAYADFGLSAVAAGTPSPKVLMDCLKGVGSEDVKYVKKGKTEVVVDKNNPNIKHVSSQSWDEDFMVINQEDQRDSSRDGIYVLSQSGVRFLAQLSPENRDEEEKFTVEIPGHIPLYLNRSRWDKKTYISDDPNMVNDYFAQRVWLGQDGKLVSRKDEAARNRISLNPTEGRVSELIQYIFRGLNGLKDFRSDELQMLKRGDWDDQTETEVKNLIAQLQRDEAALATCDQIDLPEVHGAIKAARTQNAEFLKELNSFTLSDSGGVKGADLPNQNPGTAR